MRFTVNTSLRSVFKNLHALGYLHNAKRVKLVSRNPYKSQTVTKTYAMIYLLESKTGVEYRYDG